MGILGFGTVGGGAFRMLCDNSEAIARKIGLRVEVARIGIRDPGKPRAADIDLFTTDLEAVVDDPSIDVVLELIGGIEPAGRLVERALANGKHVVAANKELIAKQGARLLRLAASHGLHLHFEAAVGGGIPLVQPLRHQLAGNDVLKLMGILNGTTNSILTRMAQDGASFDEALTEAQAKGYAEADPTSDVDGHDTAYKIAILTSIALGRQTPIEAVYREGIRGVDPVDIHYAEVLGYRIKLLGIAEPMGEGRALVRVHPAMVRRDHPLASVDGVYNALWLHGDFVGDVMLSGRGAGSDPTASAVVGDLIEVGRDIRGGMPGSPIPFGDDLDLAPIEEVETSYYVRLVVLDKPRVLGAIATAFGGHEVSLSAMEMRVLDAERSLGEIVFLTHRCREANFRAALRAVVATGVVAQVANWIRVEE